MPYLSSSAAGNQEASADRPLATAADLQPAAFAAPACPVNSDPSTLPSDIGDFVERLDRLEAHAAAIRRCVVSMARVAYGPDGGKFSEFATARQTEVGS